MMKYGEVTSTNEDNRESREIELHGVLQKKSRKGFYQNRYFRTSGVLLSYYKDQMGFERSPLFPKASFKFTDMTSVQLHGADGRFSVSFAISFLDLELKAVNEAQAIHWTSFVKAKINLYSVNMLLTMDTSLMNSGPSLLFVTTTFRQLMQLKPSDQDSWNQTSLNSHFEAIFANKSAGRLSVDELCSLLLGASHKALDDFVFACEQCETEYKARNPRVIAHCREYMRRYTKLLCGRLILELSSILGPTEDINLISPHSTLEVVCLLQRFSLLSRYSFLPAAELSGVFDNLKSLDYMCDSYVHITNYGLRYWLGKVAQLQPRQQGKILSDVPIEIETNISLLRPYKDKLQENTYLKLLKGSMSGMLSALHTFLVSFSFEDFSDESLTDHIVACLAIDQYTADACRAWAPQSLISSLSSPSTFNLFLTESENEKNPAKQLLDISDACRRNAMRAAADCVRKVLPGLQELLSLFFYENDNSNQGWLGGRACKALLLRLSSWIDSMRNSVPAEYLVLVKAEAYRFVVVLYYSTFIGFYRANKKAQLSSEGVAQVTMDLRLIEMWIAETGVCSECEPLKEIIKKMRLYLTCEATDLLVCFSGSVQDFAATCPLYAYDLFRVAMKLRDDIPADYRRRVLGMCTEYMAQFKNVYEKTYGDKVDSLEADEFLSGSDYFSCRMSGESILSEIMPSIGSEHCTGKKWSLERAPLMSAEEHIFIINLVTEACHHIRMMRLSQRSSITISARAVVGPLVVGVSEPSVPTVESKSVSASSGPVAVSQKHPANMEWVANNNTNPFESDDDEEDEDLEPYDAGMDVTPPAAAPSSSPVNVIEPETEVRSTRAYTRSFDNDEDNSAPRVLRMENVSYEGAENLIDPLELKVSEPLFQASHHALRRSQVIYLHGDHFKEFHESLKPDHMVLKPYTGPALSLKREASDRNLDLDASTIASVEKCAGTNNDASGETSPAALCSMSNDLARPILLASYSAEYLLVSPDISSCDRDIVSFAVGLSENTDGDANNEAGGSVNESQPPLDRPLSITRVDPTNLFIVPPVELSGSRDPEDATKADKPSKPQKPRRSSSIRPEIIATRQNRVSAVFDTSENSDPYCDYGVIPTPYVVIYGPGTVIRRDLSIESERLCAVPCARSFEVFESTAVRNDEGILRVRARYRGINGWTSFKARDGTTIIEPCVPTGKSVLVTPPTKPPKRKSVTGLRALGTISMEAEDSSAPSPDAMCNMISPCGSASSQTPRRDSITSDGGLSVTSDADLRYETGKPPPKPPRRSITRESPLLATATSTGSLRSDNDEQVVSTTEENLGDTGDDHNALPQSSARAELGNGEVGHVQECSDNNSLLTALSSTSSSKECEIIEIESQSGPDVGLVVDEAETEDAQPMGSIVSPGIGLDENVECEEVESVSKTVRGGVEPVSIANAGEYHIDDDTSNHEAACDIEGDSVDSERSVDNQAQSVSLSPGDIKTPSKSSQLGSPPRDVRPAKPPKGHPGSIPVAMLYTPEETERRDISPAAVAVAVSLPPELEVIDPNSTERRRGSATQNEAPQRLSRVNSHEKDSERVGCHPYNPFDDSDDDLNESIATAAPRDTAAGSDVMDLAAPGITDSQPSEEPKRRKSRLRNRLGAVLNLRRHRSSTEESRMSADSRSHSADEALPDADDTSSSANNPFATGEDSRDEALTSERDSFTHRRSSTPTG